IWKVAAPALDILAPDDYQDDDAAYLKVLELYHREDNALFVPETGGADKPRFFFSALGLQTIGFAPFGLDYTHRPADKSMNQADASRPQEEFLTPWAMNYRLIGPMQREIARLNFEGKLQAVAEEQGRTTEILPFGSWNAEVTFGTFRGGSNPPGANPAPAGRILVAQLADNQFLVAGYYCRIDFRPAGTEQQRKSKLVVPGTDETPSALIDGKWQHRQFLRLEQVTWEGGTFQHVRTWGGRGGETNGLYFGEVPVVLRVSLTTY